MTKLPKAIYRFSTFSIKIPVVFFYKTRASNSKIFMEMQKKKKKPQKSKNNLEKEQVWKYHTFLFTEWEEIFSNDISDKRLI